MTSGHLTVPVFELKLEILETATQYVVTQVRDKERKWLATYTEKGELLEFLNGYYGC